MKKLALLNGPNLDRLGTRETHLYGSGTLPELEASLKAYAETRGASLECFQSNHEGALVDKLWSLADAGCEGVVFNPGAYTHTSVALRDALSGSKLRAVEVHISNLYQREAFRHTSYTAGVSVGVISGLGRIGYRLALDFLLV